MNREELLYPVENAYRHHMLLDGMWFFAFETTPGPGWEGGIPKDCLVPVPASFPEFFLRKEEREFAGNIWYERSVYVPKSWLGEDIFLRLDGVAQRFSVFVNGMEVGRFEDCAVPTAVEVTRHLRYGDTNAIVIKVNNVLTEDTLPAGAVHTISGNRRINISKTNDIPASGLVKSVHLYAVPNTRILDFEVSTLTINREKAEIHYTAKVRGNCLVTATLRNRDGKVVATGVGGNATLTVENPHPWSIGDGYLYQIDFEVSRLGKQCDAYSVTFGIRTFICEKGAFFLNNNRIHLKGWYLGLGHSSTRTQKQFDILRAKQEFVLMKELGANCLLTGPDALSEEILQLAAAEGILVVNQIPYIKPKPKDEKIYQANFTADNGEEQPDYTYLVNRNVPERDKNCASLMAIAIGPVGFNQTDANPLPGSWAEILPKEYRYGRPLAVTVQVGLLQEADTVLDNADIIVIAGYGAYDTGIDVNGDDAYESLHRDLLALQGRFPDTPVIAVFDPHYTSGQIFDDAYRLEESYDNFIKVLHSTSNVKGEILLTAEQDLKLLVLRRWTENKA